MKRLITIMAIFLTFAASLFADGHHASVNVTSGGDGTVENPWGLTDVLSGVVSVPLGDTVYVHGAVYDTFFIVDDSTVIRSNMNILNNLTVGGVLTVQGRLRVERVVPIVSLTLYSPADTTNKLSLIFYSTTDSLIIRHVMCVGYNCDSVDVDVEVLFGPDVSQRGTSVTAVPMRCNSVTTGNAFTEFINYTIPPRNFLWVKMPAIRKSPKAMDITVAGYRR